MSDVVHFERRGDVALITIDSPPVNSLSTAVVEGLFARVAEANKDPGVRAMVITGARENFIAGADITGLQALAEGKGKLDSQNIGALTGKLEELEANAKPVVMAIDGFALGGGLEVAMAGHWRVGTTRCRCGLPELTLGIIPGAAGTQRLPRIVGVQKATEMMLTSAEVRGKDALAAGIVQELVEPDKLIDAAIAAARKLADGQAKPVRASQLTDKIGTADQARMIMEGAKMLGGDKLRNLVHPHLCMDAILTGVVDGYAAGIKREAENFAKCLASPQAAGMIHIFFATRAAEGAGRDGSKIRAQGDQTRRRARRRNDGLGHCHVAVAIGLRGRAEGSEHRLRRGRPRTDPCEPRIARQEREARPG